VQARLDRNPDKMRVRRQTVEHPFGTIKSWMGSTHFQMKTLKHVGTIALPANLNHPRFYTVWTRSGHRRWRSEMA
jgi:hypothetical protein